jgi:hypothetical protein
MYFHESGGYYSDTPDPQFNVRRAEPQAPISARMTEPTLDEPQSDNNMYYVAVAAIIAALYLLRKR